MTYVDLSDQCLPCLLLCLLEPMYGNTSAWQHWVYVSDPLWGHATKVAAFMLLSKLLAAS